MPEICFYPQNVWHEFWERIENVEIYTHPRSMFSSQQMFSTNIRRELKMLGFMHILEICLHPQMFGTNFRDKIENVFFTHPRNMFPTPKCLAQISG